MGRLSACAFTVLAVCGLSSANAASVFTFNSVVSLRELFREFEGPDFEFRNIGDVTLDAQSGRLYVDAQRDGVVMLNESDLTIAGYYTDLLPSVFLTFEMPAFAVEPTTGNVYIYDVLCDDCVGTNLPFLAELTVLSPQGDVLSVQHFEPFRYENGNAASFTDMVFELGGKLRMFDGGVSATLDLTTGEFGPLTVYAQNFTFDAGGVFDPITGHLFGLTSANVMYEFDPTTNEMLNIAELDELISYPYRVPGARRPFGMVFSADGSKLYVTTELGGGDSPGRGALVVLNRTIVPEPSTMALASIALGLAVIQRRRLRSRA